MPGRSFDAGGYRYGFNGKEKDSNGEWGSNVAYDYGFRIYNPSIAKFLSVDPLTKSYPMLTPYQFAGNMPIVAIDLDGLEPYIPGIYRPELNPDLTKPEIRQLRAAQVLLIVGVEAAIIGGIYASPYISTTPSALGPVVTAIAAWLQNPTNQQYIAEGGAFIAGIVDPNPAAQYSAGYGDEFGNFVGGIFRTAGKQALEYIFRSPAGDDIVTGSAKLVDDVLELDFAVPKELRKSGIGSQMFQDALNQFGDKVKAVKGSWFDGDNLKAFNEGIKKGLSATEAAFNTPTGKLAARNGFTNIEWKRSIPSETNDGTVEAIELIFKK